MYILPLLSLILLPPLPLHVVHFHLPQQEEPMVTYHHCLSEFTDTADHRRSGINTWQDFSGANRHYQIWNLYWPIHNIWTCTCTLQLHVCIRLAQCHPSLCHIIILWCNMYLFLLAMPMYTWVSGRAMSIEDWLALWLAILDNEYACPLIFGLLVMNADANGCIKYCNSVLGLHRTISRGNDTQLSLLSVVLKLSVSENWKDRPGSWSDTVAV